MDSPKRCSLVYGFGEALKDEYGLGGPEPSYLKWLDGLLFAETGNAADEACYDGNEKEIREAWKIYGDAVSATQDLLELYRKDAPLFRKVARHFSVLPCLMSWHPASEKFNRSLYEDSQLGEESLLCEQAPHGRHYAYQSWPVRYAYALLTTIHLTLDSYDDRLPLFAEIYGYGIKHPVDPEEIEEILARGKMSEQQKEKIRRNYKGAYRVLPKWTKGLKRLQRIFSRDSVLCYWRKGKEIILEEVPDFHLRPEWKSYRERRYAHGAKRSAVQHAIFKDILIALRTIAGANKGGTKRQARKGTGDAK